MAHAELLWAELDDAWQGAFAMAWEAAATGNIGVGAVVSDEAGAIVTAARNRVSDRDAPSGQIAGSSLAHAEINALARLPYRSERTLTLTTTLRPCLQCAAAIRMAPIATVRVAGDDPLFRGGDDFTGLNDRLARRGRVPSIGPRRDEIGTFATLIARTGPSLIPHVEEELLGLGEAPIIELVQRIEDDGTLAKLLRGPVDMAFAHLWPHLVDATPAHRGGDPAGRGGPNRSSRLPRPQPEPSDP